MKEGWKEAVFKPTNLKHLHDEVRSFGTEMTGKIKLTALNLPKEHVDARVFKRQRPTQQCIENDPTAPDIYFRT